VILPIVIYCAMAIKGSYKWHVLGILVCISGAADFLTLFIINDPKLFPVVFNIYEIFQFSLLGLLYFKFREKSKLIFIGIFVYVLSYLSLFVMGGSLYTYNNLQWSISSIVFIVLAFEYFINLFVSPLKLPEAKSMLWINTGVLFFFAFSLWLYTIGDYVLYDAEPVRKMELWAFHNFNNTIKNILFAIGIYYSKR
jgi:hypothetical protein